ncbi:glr2685 [Gloeobacter violaceus PCC 7421]|uniref:Glr2685 protein n=1 Tax=Gloeobacter violaceus (strain ATCC 29082 / PCC 7421) TaxID=251221 RepID=Q7NH52_GLOVI|nr:glr2685 [Gloeobacter violaceus PCC 7421]
MLMEPLLPGAPWLVAHRSMLDKERPRRITLNGRDYVLWQDRQGEVFALDNVCPHMQAPLSEGWVCAGRITCPFHTLEFDALERWWRVPWRSSSSMTASGPTAARCHGCPSPNCTVALPGITSFWASRATGACRRTFWRAYLSTTTSTTRTAPTGKCFGSSPARSLNLSRTGTAPGSRCN